MKHFKINYLYKSEGVTIYDFRKHVYGFGFFKEFVVKSFCYINKYNFYNKNIKYNDLYRI
uniref:Orf59 n=1 Tax=Acavomonas peruviana TaxID=1542312 RepID=V5KWJ4_9ALVE|nr:orf59 [Acavomonas peruviana]